jgi:hypothetical protein
MKLTEFQDYLVELITYKAEWRDEKAFEYPEDDRNRRNAKALRALANQLVVLPTTNAKLRELWSVHYRLRKPGEKNVYDDASPFIDAEQGVLRLYGFHVEEDGNPEQFLDRWIASLRHLIEEPD